VTARSPSVWALRIDRDLTGRVRQAGRAALDLLLPLQCALCEAAVEQPGQLCADCFGRTGFITEPCCARCGVPFAVAGQGGALQLCPACRDAAPVFGEARAALRYDRQARRLVLPFKHADRLELARVLAPHMARAGAALLRRAELLIPVPLHRRRLFYRRYNQAALLAQALSRLSGRPAIVDAMQRVRPTVPLGDKSPEARAATVADAFVVRPWRASAILGKRLLLIDDVMTSGATANACASTLLAAGAAAVDVLVAARVPDPRLQ
jgi:ComF family protein